MISDRTSQCRARAGSADRLQGPPRLAAALCTMAQHGAFNPWNTTARQAWSTKKHMSHPQEHTGHPSWQLQQQQQQQQQQQTSSSNSCDAAPGSKPFQCVNPRLEQRQQQQQGHAIASSLLSSVLVLQALFPQHAAAHVAIDKLMQQQQEPALQSALTAGFDPAAAAAVRAAATGNFSSSSSNTSRQRQSPVASAAAQALSQLQSAQQAQRGGDYAAALTAYSAVVAQHPDLALAEYARLGRALMLYETGDTSNALIGLQDQELSMRGYPEVHAALAAVLYTERPAQRLRAEQQFNIAVEFDSRFQDAGWVARNKAWGPRLMGALQKFLLLQ